ncbi:hypothetical protein [Maridesulfovibrio zosterae]|uniref:hypothetical protein n=1 Tax=Maridesulfovibrio zosterae TaxID=82171 RepID=UPI000419B8F3|nr:hypothetical protein [Maridesulfovibrio zosterae]
MSVELYFALGVFLIAALKMFFAAEELVEHHVLGGVDKSYEVIHNFCSNHKKIEHDSNEFYCFFKKSAFDIK